ncbi:MAG: glycoside hydrolase family 13 protein [Proteobacteria bacterium]|nr:glycoside hydrolase family 13 protein [Pseudomonadota bacterium]
MTPTTPEWVKNAVFYQIFPDRFSRSPRTHHPPGIELKPWGSPPQEQGYQGGDLRGIVDRLDYLQELGITAFYLNPIFASASNHRYHTFDYLQVDPLLGGNEALRELLDEAHARNMKVVLDGVFNHASRGFWPFHHILENGSDSPYLDWFHIRDWPLRPYASSARSPSNYDCWANLPMLPKLNTNNPGVRDYLFGVARHWLEFGIDGWRLDVPDEIDDSTFWQTFRQIVKETNSDAYLCGEIWYAAQRWLRGDQFDAVMNYPFMRLALGFFGSGTLRTEYKQNLLEFEALDVSAFASAIDGMHGLYDWAINFVQLNLLDSHDTARALSIVGGDKDALRLSALFQMVMPGAPCIYYGDEIGMSSAGDPHCRAAFPWHDESVWDMDLLHFYRRATALRHRYPVLRTGTFRALHAGDDVYAFHRGHDRQEAVVAFNVATEPRSLRVARSELSVGTWRTVWPEPDGSHHQGGSQALLLTVPARSAVVLIGE